MRVGQVKNEGKSVLSRRNNGSKIVEAQNRKMVVGDYNKVGTIIKWKMQGKEY